MEVIKKEYVSDI